MLSPAIPTARPIARAVDMTRFLVASLAALMVLLGAGMTAGNTSAYAYDGPPVVRADVHEVGAAEAELNDAADAREGSAPPPVEARGTSTTPVAGFVATEAGQFWPDTPEELDAMLGITGTRVPDGPTTPGRGKVIWDLPSGKRITSEAHPYHTDALAFRREPHFHVDEAGAKSHSPSGRRLPGDPFDC